MASFAANVAWYAPCSKVTLRVVLLAMAVQRLTVAPERRRSKSSAHDDGLASMSTPVQLSHRSYANELECETPSSAPISTNTPRKSRLQCSWNCSYSAQSSRACE